MPIPARVVGVLLVIAVVALVDVATEGRGAAIEDGPHYASLPTVEVRQWVTALTEDVSQLQLCSTSPAVSHRRALHASALD